MFYFIFIIRDYHLLPLNFLYIIFNIIKAMLIKISDKSRIVTQRRQKKNILSVLYYFSVWRNGAICIIHVGSRLDSAQLPTPNDGTRLTFDPGTKTLEQMCWN